MGKIDFMALILTAIIAFGFLIGGIFEVLDNFVVKYLLFGVFITVVIYMFYAQFKNETHHKP